MSMTIPTNEQIATARRRRAQALAKRSRLPEYDAAEQAVLDVLMERDDDKPGVNLKQLRALLETVRDGFPAYVARINTAIKLIDDAAGQKCETCHGTGTDHNPGLYYGSAECPQCEGEGVERFASVEELMDDLNDTPPPLDVGALAVSIWNEAWKAWDRGRNGFSPGGDAQEAVNVIVKRLKEEGL